MYEPVRICGRGCNGTIHPHLEEKTFPLPTPQEVFSTLASGESFSKIDLPRANKQMEVEESSRQYLTINTHLGFRYRRLPFGISTAPAIIMAEGDVNSAARLSKSCRRHPGHRPDKVRA